MDNPYQTPGSSVTPEEVSVVATLRRQESLIGAMVCGLLVPPVLMFALFAMAGNAVVIPGIVFAIPGLACGFAMRVLARPFRLWVVVAGSMCALVSSLAVLYLAQASVFAYGIGVVGCIGCVMTGQRSLTTAEEAAVLRAQP